ncbi:MAG: lipoyl synthase, partial [Chitinophagales bacterium]
IRRTKSGMMLGLGETKDEIIEALHQLRSHYVDIVTLGQYLQPTKKHLAVQKYLSPEEFKELESIALELGFMYVESGPLVRSSYHAEKHIL